MAVPRQAAPRLFYRAAYQRIEDARFLFSQNRTTAAIYLGGYSVECILKALILAAVPASRHHEIQGTFRGKQAHEFERLRRVYLQHSTRQFPSEINLRLARVNTWTTDLRYFPCIVKTREAADFLDSADRILTWADSRL